MLSTGLRYNRWSQFHLPQGDERGAIIPLLLLLAVPLIALIAIVADLGLVLNASRDMEYKTRNAALSAASAFQDEYRRQIRSPTFCAGCESDQGDTTSQTICCAVEAARKRAEEIVGANISLGEKFLNDPSDRNTSVELITTDYEGESDDNQLRIGQYNWFCEEDECPEDSPQFTIHDPYSPTTLSLSNAFELRTRTKSSNQILSQFARVFGIDGFSVQSMARAAILPRNDMFLVDLSRSMYRDNYRNDRGFGTDAEFIYLVTEDPDDDAELSQCSDSTTSSSAYVCCNTLCVSKGADDPGCIECRMDPDCSTVVDHGDYYGWDTRIFRCMYGSSGTVECPLPDVQGAPGPAGMMHYSNHYRCVEAPYSWNDHEVLPRKYLVDFGRPWMDIAATALSSSARPEPLFSVLGAVNSALNSLLQRNMSVDRMGLIAFDDDEDNTVDFNPRFLPPSAPDVFAIREMEMATRILNAGDPTKGFLSRALMPRPGHLSDIFQPLREAAYQISLEPSYRIAKNSITIFTDGLQNCVYARTLAAGDDAWWSGWTRANPEEPCINDGVNVILGIKNLTDPDFVAELRRRQIAVNVILFGQLVRPHRLVRKNPSGTGCLDQIEDNHIGATETSLVNSNWDTYLGLAEGGSADPDALRALFYNASADNPFLASNRLYPGLVAPTRGLWLPVMPPLEVTSATPPATTRSVFFWEELQGACRAALDQNPLGSLSLDVPDPFNSAGPPLTRVVTDAEGRLLYDPLGASIEDQMQRFVDQIVQNPYVLVQ